MNDLIRIPCVLMADCTSTRPRQAIFAAAVLAAGVYCLADAAGFSFPAQVFPLAIGALVLGSALLVLLHLGRGDSSAIHDDAAAASLAGQWSGREACLAAFAALVAGIWLVGFVPAMAVFFPAFLIVAGKASLPRTAILTASALAFILGITWAMNLRLPEGMIWSLVA